MNNKWGPVDYIFAFGVSLILYIFAHLSIMSYIHSDHCEEICYPQNYAVSARLFTTEVSCICDLTKERIEIP